MKEQVWKQAWRPAAAYIYLTICLADFVFFPAYYMWANSQVSDSQVVNEALKFKDSASQVEVLKTLRHDQVWVPITTAGAGMVHLAFGSILGVAAWTRGKEKIARVSDVDEQEGK